MSRKLVALAALLAITLNYTAPVISAESGASEPLPEQLDIATALRYAIDHNYTIQQARERIREQDGVILQVKSELIPHASVAAQYTMTDQSLGENLGLFENNHDIQNWNIGITISQLIYAGGGVTASVSAQKSVREAALLDLESVINDVLLLVRTRFYNVLLAREQIKVQEENLKLLDEQNTIAKNRYDAGAASSFEVLRAQVSIANAKPNLIRARNSYRNAIDLLRQTLGYSSPAGGAPEKNVDFAGNLDVAPATYDLAGAIGAARANRPELKRLAQLVGASESGIDAAKSGYKPTVAAFGNYTFEKDMTRPPLNGFGYQVSGWNLGIQASWAVFDGRATAGKVAQARSKLNQTRLQTADATLAVEVEVRQAYSSFQEAVELVDAAQKVNSQAEEALRLANSRYAAGTATQLDVLTSQLALTESRLNQVQANYSYNVAVASLRKATGQSDPIYTTK